MILAYINHQLFHKQPVRVISCFIASDLRAIENFDTWTSDLLNTDQLHHIHHRTVSTIQGPITITQYATAKCVKTFAATGVESGHGWFCQHEAGDWEVASKRSPKMGRKYTCKRRAKDLHKSSKVPNVFLFGIVCLCRSSRRCCRYSPSFNGCHGSGFRDSSRLFATWPRPNMANIITETGARRSWPCCQATNDVLFQSLPSR